MILELRNGIVIYPDGNRLKMREDSIFIDQGKIVQDLAGKTPDRIIDCGGRIILPGLVNAHHHIYSCLAKGIPVRESLDNFEGVLKKLWWRLDRTLNEEDVILSTALTLEDCIRYGVTTIFDHHISSSFIRDSLKRMGEVFDAYELNGVLCFEISGRNGQEVFLQSLEENLRFYEEARGNLRGMIGMHASFTLSDDQLQEISRQIDNAPIHIHVAEAPYDAIITREKYKRGLIERLDYYGLLNPDSLLIHCNLLSDEELEVLARKPVFAAHNIESAMNNALQAGNIHKMIEKGIRVVSGTDGMSSDILSALRMASFYTKQLNRNPDIGYTEFESMLLQGWNLKTNFGYPLGIQSGEAADIAVMDYIPVTPIDPGNIVGHLLFGACGREARWVLKGHSILLDDGILCNRCEDRSLEKSKRAAQRLHERFVK